MRRIVAWIARITSKRRFVRYGLLALNIVLLGGIVIFVAQSTPSDSNSQSATSLTSDAPTDPLDQLSSADIAVNLAQMTNMPEVLAVTNQADSVGAELTAPPAQTTIISKPQAVATALKSRGDIKTHTVAAGETISSIATVYGVTSESILWSNGLTGNTVAAGTKLTIPPVNGIVYTVKAGDNPDTLAQKYRASKEQIIAYNDAELSGLKVGEQIIIPNGQQPTTTRSGYGGLVALGGFAATYGYNGYDYGFCTWYVADRRAKIGRPLPSNLGDAWTWDDRAAAAGIRVNNSPAVGAAVVTNTSRRPGHVAIVEVVNADGSVWISEMNSRGQVSITDTRPTGGWGKPDYKFISADQARSYNYIH